MNSDTEYRDAIAEILAIFDDDPQMTEDVLKAGRDDQHTAESYALEKIREIARTVLEGHREPATPVTMGHMDAIQGALTSAVCALGRGAMTREWDSLQAATGEAWADIQRAIGYAQTLKGRVPDGPGFEASP